MAGTSGPRMMKGIVERFACGKPKKQMDNDLHDHDYESVVLYEPMGSMTFLCAGKHLSRLQALAGKNPPGWPVQQKFRCLSAVARGFKVIGGGGSFHAPGFDIGLRKWMVEKPIGCRFPLKQPWGVTRWISPGIAELGCD